VLATFRRLDSRAEELAAFQRLPFEKQVIELGQRLVIDKGCNQCHTIAPGGKPFASVLASASFDDIKQPGVETRGCLADAAGQRGTAPKFHLDGPNREAIRSFMHEGTMGAGTPAPAHAGRVTIQRFNCLACHNRDGEGGLTADVIEELRKFEKADNAEAVSPPPLTGVAHKLRTSWLKQVLTQAGRARPWMGLRMPQFGEANVGRLPDSFAALEGIEAADAEHRIPLSAARLEAGRSLIGRQAFGCISCHDIAGIANTSTRGPDLALMNQRVRYPWYRRWLENAQRVHPGTRMPTIFPDGKSLLTTVLDGEAGAQADAMWAYLSLGSGLPLPEGLEPPKGLVVIVSDRPVLIRTFMPEAGARAIAVGFPHGVSAAFDAATCRLAYAWSGNFLDATPVWANRGGNPAKVLGARFWTAPVGCPLAATFSDGVPDFTAQARDPAFGGPVPDGKLYEGPHQLVFEGYTATRDGMPTFRYRLNADTTQPLLVEERPDALRNPVAVGVARRFNLTVPAQQKVWLLAGECTADPRLLDANGLDLKPDLKAGTTDLPNSGQLVVLPQGGDRAVILAIADGPPETRWHLVRQGGRWQILVTLAAGTESRTVRLGVNIWAPYRDEPQLVKELIPRK
jgi:hypothetical protein